MVNHNRGMQLVHKLVQEAKLKELETLLQQNPALVCVDDNLGMKPLHYAARTGSPECVKLLIEKGADVNAKSKRNSTAIFEASNIEVAKILVENGVNLNIVNCDGNIPLKYAIARQHIDVIRYLISQGANVNHTKRLDFYNTMTQSALSRVVHKSTQQKKEQALEILEILLQAGANPNIQSVYGTTVLHDASRRGLIEFVQLLLRYGADPCIRSVVKESCFEYAEQFPEILRLFEPYKLNLQPIIEIQDSPERLIERLLKIGFVDRSQFKPCSEAEIKDLERKNRVKLPESYKKFLRIMGKGAGWFLVSDSWEVFYEDLSDRLGVDFFTIPEAEYHEYTQEEIDFASSIPDNFFVFATRQGDLPLGFIADGIDEDPDIYLVDEPDIKLWGKTFWKFIQDLVEYYEFYCNPNKFSKTAVPWSAKYKR